uniref:Uncharacterized protein n=1 Tax=Ciona savignyi TaxID=51511 RepID=H2YEZ4_CIOSA
MARHRNIRNNKSYDYDDDYDVYGQSYEDDYGVSPGTIAQYSYSRSSGKDVNISSYMPSEDTVEEEVWEDDLCFESSAAAQRHRSSGSVDTSSLNPIMLDACLDHIRDAVGENYSENQMRQASAKFNCNYEKAIDFLLNSSGQPSNSKNTTSLNQNDLNVTKVAPNFTTPVKTGFVMSPNRFTQDPVNHTNGVSIGQTKLGTSSDSKTALISTPQKNKISMNANVSTPSKHNKPSFDYKVKIISAGKLYFINAEYAKREKEEKKQISLVVIGHVDAGKSTMMGHLLYQQGVVSKRLIHKYEQESKKIGKTSFAYAWVLDETGEERSRGVTMDHATLTLHGVDIMKVTTGSVLCDIDNPIRAVTRIQARIIVFSIEVPITRGFPVELHYKSVHEPAIIRRIISQLHRSTGEVVTKKPKFISKGHNALVEVELTRPVCLEEYSSLKELGRFTLRYGGSTIAACVVTKLLQ